MTKQDRENLIEQAPADAVVIYDHADGRVAYFSQGAHLFNESLKVIQFDTGNKPGANEILATKKSDGSWYWYKNQGVEAIKTLRGLGYTWNKENEKWEKKEEA